ncbi:lysine N(6)-hydroxylase/L-ornithine N(5)-oxygenase family protein [Nonomuraea typhae]|uniref:lysine N(6)-hydroxylase/L-ornithine N(5)-oxygenase family protein n=1 Tax=Nonomuraea typhae TaxID=2603600 RepID=UPI0012FA9266|nr:lysine N(6)-hydroxylase/L-ornithine N(5)-oxygenase family protein [Nonomuraea typhae]
MVNTVHDLVGIGFGPSNLALAIALNEAEGAGVDALFLEKQEAFGWHRGMLLDGATMQVSFLKDLVTMRNPASAYSFVGYLHAKERLAEFINQKTMYPTRLEFHDYLEWVAAHFEHVVRYGTEVITVDPVVRDGEVRGLDIVSRADGELLTHRTRNVAIAAGLRPVLPEGVISGDRVWHSQELLHRLDAFAEPYPRRFVVVGAGQSAAEVVEHLHTRFPSAEICAVFSRYGYSPADDSPFANSIFDPAAVDHFFEAPGDVKRQLMGYHANTNYSVVDLDLLQELYRRIYQEKVAGRPRLRIMNMCRAAGLETRPGGVSVGVRSLVSGESATLNADAVVYATGYRPTDPLDLLGAAGEYCLRDASGELKVGRDHRVETSPEMICGIYLQGATEHTHGITSTLLSTTAVRSGEILRSVRAHARSGVGEPAR